MFAHQGGEMAPEPRVAGLRGEGDPLQVAARSRVAPRGKKQGRDDDIARIESGAVQDLGQQRAVEGELRPRAGRMERRTRWME